MSARGCACLLIAWSALAAFAYFFSLYGLAMFCMFFVGYDIATLMRNAPEES